jgi:O-antigen ligase
MHPAVLGTYIVACLPFSLFLIEREIFLDRFLGILCLVLGFLGIGLTFSRGSLLGVIVVFLVWFWQKNKILHFKYLAMILLILIFACSFSRDYLSFHRFGIRGLLQKSVFQGRIVRTITCYRMVKEHPFFGVGLSHFRKNYNKYSPEPRQDEDGKTPDSTYLLFLSEAGIVGFLCFFNFLWHLLKKGFRNLYLIKSTIDRDMLIAIIAGLVGLLVNMNTYDLLYWISPLFLFSILAGMIAGFSADTRF